MRIAIDVQSTLGPRTGIGVYTANLLRWLPRVEPEVELTRLALGREGDLRTPRRMLWEQVQLPLLARRARANLLHVPGFAAPLAKPCPVVLTVHDLIGMLFPRHFPPISRFYWSAYLPFTVRFVHHILADSQNTKRDLMRLLGIPQERITVVYPGVGEEFHPRSKEELARARRRLRLPARYILYVGTIEPRKGLDTLVRAYALLRRRGFAQRLVIAGKKGWHVERLLALVEELGLKRDVLFPGYVPERELPFLYNLADLLAFPSRYEGFGLPVLEAMACGVPVVCSNVASLPEIVGDAALMLRPDAPELWAEEMARLLTDEELRARLRWRGRKQAQRFSWKKTAREVYRVYRRLENDNRLR